MKHCEMCVEISRFPNIGSQIKQIGVIVTHLEVVCRGIETQLQVGDFFECSAL